VVIWDQAGFHPKPELHVVPEHVHWCRCRPIVGTQSTEAIGDVVKDRIGNVLWNTIADLEQSTARNCVRCVKIRMCAEAGFSSLARRTSKRYRNRIVQLHAQSGIIPFRRNRLAELAPPKITLPFAETRRGFADFMAGGKPPQFAASNLSGAPVKPSCA